jgi:hypothetical protein
MLEPSNPPWIHELLFHQVQLRHPQQPSPIPCDDDDECHNSPGDCAFNPTWNTRVAIPPSAVETAAAIVPPSLVVVNATTASVLQNMVRIAMAAGPVPVCIPHATRLTSPEMQWIVTGAGIVPRGIINATVEATSFERV